MKNENKEYLKKEYLICKPGKYPQGSNQVIITANDLENIANSYNPEFHEAPITLDHAQSGPAYGYVSHLSFHDNGLYASFGELSPELIELVNSGKYKRPSVEIAIYKKDNGDTFPYLRAVSLVPFPAVKSIPALQFSEISQISLKDTNPSEISSEPDTLIFSSDSIINFSNNKINNNMKEKIIKLAESFSLPAADEETALTNLGNKITSLSEINGSLQSKVAELETKLKERETKANAALVDSLIAQGKALPASKEPLLALAESDPDNFLKLSESLPVLNIFGKNLTSQPAPIVMPGNSNHTDILVDGKPVTYSDVLKDIKLQEKLSEQQIVSLREKYFSS